MKKLYEVSMVWDTLDVEYKLTEVVGCFQKSLGTIESDNEDEIIELFEWLDKGLSKSRITDEQAAEFIANFNRQ